MCKAITIPGRRCCALEFGIGSLPTPEKATVEAITNADGKPARKITVQGTSPDVLAGKVAWKTSA